MAHPVRERPVGYEMSLNLDYAPEQQELSVSLGGFCDRIGVSPDATVQEPLLQPYWSGLADLGVLGLGTVLVGGGALEISAAMVTLGSKGGVGPLVPTFMAGAILGSSEMEGIAAGTKIVSVGEPPLMPWAPQADLYVEIAEGSAWLGVPTCEVIAVDTTAREPWGYVDIERQVELGDASAAIARGDLACAAYLVGAATTLMERTVEYAKDRKQFGRPIASFQALSHPLAKLSVELRAAELLVRIAAYRLDSETPEAEYDAAVARLSATRVSTSVAYQSHQVFGAMGFTVEGPVANLAQRIRQTSLMPPGPEFARSQVMEGMSRASL
ncbi:MAG: acyl-CoA dehydrogenase [Chloroflexi bacterium]|nr:acyl-CoA dehydrogenase [Chloroflexota bacterium]